MGKYDCSSHRGFPLISLLKYFTLKLKKTKTVKIKFINPHINIYAVTLGMMPLVVQVELKYVICI